MRKQLLPLILQKKCLYQKSYSARSISNIGSLHSGRKISNVLHKIHLVLEKMLQIQVRNLDFTVKIYCFVKKKELEICQHKKMPLLFRSLYITLYILVKTRWIVTDTFNSYGHQQNLRTNWWRPYHMNCVFIVSKSLVTLSIWKMPRWFKARKKQ